MLIIPLVNQYVVLKLREVLKCDLGSWLDNKDMFQIETFNSQILFRIEQSVVLYLVCQSPFLL